MKNDIQILLIPGLDSTDGEVGDCSCRSKATVGRGRMNGLISRGSHSYFPTGVEALPH